MPEVSSIRAKAIYRAAAALLLGLGVRIGAPAQAAPPTDPLAGYYGNTLVCAGGADGNDACHIWLERDGSFIMFGLVQGGHQGHYKVGPASADGRVAVCLTLDTAGVEIPPELQIASPAAPAATALPATPAPDQIMLQRFHDGVCYRLARHEVGDHWTQADNPLPAQGGRDQLFLVPGHR